MRDEQRKQAGGKRASEEFASVGQNDLNDETATDTADGRRRHFTRCKYNMNKQSRHTKGLVVGDGCHIQRSAQRKGEHV